jgi:hypothetical protein
MIGPHRSEGVDQAALAEALVIVRRHPKRNLELAELMVERGWEGAAAVAAYDCQCRALHLPPWELPPCAAGTRGKDRAARLLRRMLRRGVSRYHPNPLAALAAAGPPAR